MRGFAGSGFLQRFDEHRRGDAMYGGAPGGGPYTKQKRTLPQGPAAETAKPSAARSQRLCLRPPYAPLSWAAVAGRRTGGEERRLLHLPPSSVPRKRGGPGRLGKISVRATARLREKMAPTLKGRGRVFHPTGDSGDVQQLRRSMQEKVRPQ